MAEEKKISQELLDIIACPDCKSDLVLKKNKLVCENCGHVFEIKNGIPLLLPKE